MFLFALPAFSQEAQDPATDPLHPARVLGVLPNYRIGEMSQPFQPITTKRKFYIGYKDATDYPVFIVGAALAGLSQAADSHPDFGQGMKGYAHRYWTSTSDQLVANIMTESVIPSLFHQDPRYFRKATGSTGSRLEWAFTRLFVARTDHGHWTFNASELTGNMVAAAVGNAYYPKERTGAANLQRVYLQFATDGLSQVLKEFWPDIQKKLHHKKS